MGQFHVIIYHIIVLKRNYVIREGPKLLPIFSFTSVSNQIHNALLVTAATAASTNKQTNMANRKRITFMKREHFLMDYTFANV